MWSFGNKAFIESFDDILRNIFAGDMREANIDFFGCLINLGVAFEEFEKVADGLGEVDLIIVVDAWGGVTFDADVVFTAVAKAGVLAGEALGVGVHFNAVVEFAVLL